MKYLLLAISLMSQAVSAEVWYENGSPASRRESMGGSGDFGAMIILTNDAKSVLSGWSKISPGVNIPTTERIKKGEPIEALVFFSGCTPNSIGNCITEIDYQILKPDGSVYFEHKKAELWKDKPAVPVGKLELAVDRVGLVAETGDPVGRYKIKCAVRDVVGKAEFNIESSFEVH